MSTLGSGAVPITFSADRSAIDSFLAELRQGYVVPIRPQFGGSPSSASGPPSAQSYSRGGSAGGSSSVNIDTSRAQQGLRAVNGEAKALREQLELLSRAAEGFSSRGASIPASVSREMDAIKSRLGPTPASGSPATSDAVSRRVDNNFDRAALAQQKASEREAATIERKKAQRAKQVDDAFDRAALAQQKAAEKQEDRAKRAQAGKSDAEDEGGGGSNSRLLSAGRLGRLVTGGFILSEVVQGAKAYSDANVEASLATTALARARAELKGPEAIVSSVPILGPLVQTLANRFYKSSGRAFQGAEEGQRDVDARTAADIGSRRREDQIFGIGLEGGREGIRSGYVRRGQEILDAQSVRQRQFATQTQDMYEQVQGEQDPYQRNRLALEYNRYRREQPGVLNAQKQLDQQKIDRLVEDHAYQYRQQELLTPGLREAAAGRFGPAREADFEAGLQQSAAQAKLVSPQYEALIQQQNELRRQGHAQELQADATRLRTSTLSTDLLIQRDPLASQLADIYGRRNADRVGATDSQRADIDADAEARAKLARQKYNDDLLLERGGLRARNEELGILTDQTRGTPATRALSEQVDAIRRGTQLQTLSAFQQGRGELAGDIFKGGQLQLQALQQQYTSSFRSSEVDVNRTALTGSSTEDPSVVLKDIRDAIKDLAKVPQKLQDIQDALGNLVAQ